MPGLSATKTVKNVNQAKAQSIALRLIAIRSRSKKEIHDHLKKYNFTTTTINKTICYLKTIGFINDRQLAKNWIQFRLAKKIGIYRIKIELTQKGIDPKMIDQEIKILTRQYCERDALLDVIKKKLPYYRCLTPDTRTRRLCGYLTRRGFNKELIYQTLKINF